MSNPKTKQTKHKITPKQLREFRASALNEGGKLAFLSKLFKKKVVGYSVQGHQVSIKWEVPEKKKAASTKTKAEASAKKADAKKEDGTAGK